MLGAIIEISLVPDLSGTTTEVKRILYHACEASVSCGVSRILYRVSDISLTKNNELFRKQM